MTLRSADLRFVLPHQVETANLLARPGDQRIDSFRLGLEAAGVHVGGDRPSDRATTTSDLVVAAARDAARALRVPARAHLLLGRVGASVLSQTRGRHVSLLIRGAVARPTTVVTMSPPDALRYYLTCMSFPPRLVGRLRNRALVGLSHTPVPPERLTPASALATLIMTGIHPLLVPAMLRAARSLGVPPDAQWVLALGRGDDLQRATFHLLEGGQRRWVLKFTRVKGASASFARDEAGLALIRSVGGVTAAHAPDLIGRFGVAGLIGSVETAGPGRPLLELLGQRPVPVIERVSDWVVRLGAMTAAPAMALQPERLRLEREVLPASRRLGAPDDLVERLPDVPAVLQHNDLGSWNVVSDGRAFMVIDWESARPAGLPLWDLCYFLADALPRLEGEADRETYVHRTLNLFAGRSRYSPMLFRWVRAAVRALEIPPVAVGPVVTLCWLHHGLSADARVRALGDSDAAPLGHLAVLGSHWLADPALGPSWSAWSAG